MTRKTIEPKVKIFSCFECGHPYKAFSPYSSFKDAKMHTLVLVQKLMI